MKISKLAGIAAVAIIALSGCNLFQGGSGSEKLSNPQFAYNSGNYSGSVLIEITSVEGADIRYSIDSPNPAANGEAYTGSFYLNETSTVYAIAVLAGWDDSEIVSASYTIEEAVTLSNPVFSPVVGSYEESVFVEITSPEGADIRYTLDNTIPSAGSGSLYTGGFTITQSSTVRAAAYSNELGSSGIAQAQYIIIAEAIADPVDRSFWGRWTQMDNGDEWLITDRYVAGSGLQYDVLSSNSEQITLDSNIVLVKDSDNVLSVTNGTGEYRFIRQREMGTMSGKVLGQVSTSPTGSRSLASGLAALAGIEMVIRNINNPTNTDIVTTDENGEWFSEEVIPGEEYIIEPVIIDQQEDYETVQATPVITMEDGEDVGNIIFTPAKYNFQTEYTMQDNFLYADGSTYFGITLVVKNIGTAISLGANYVLSAEEGEGVTVICDSNNHTLTDAIGSIPPNTQVTLDLRVRCEPIGNSWEDKKVFILLSSADGHVWEDSISLRFYKTKSTINLYSVGNIVNGFIMTPEGRTIDFATYPDGGRYSGLVDIPYYSGFVFAFCGAELGTESKYSFGVDREPEDTATMNDFYNTTAYEPNDDEFNSISVAMDDVVMSYLHVTDYDFFNINETKTAMPVFTTRGSNYTLTTTTEITCSTDGASIYYTEDGSEPTEESLSYTESGIIVISGTMTLKARAFRTGFEPSAIAEEQYVFPTGITVGLYDRLIPGDFFSTAELGNAYEKWYMIEIAEAGTYTFMLNDTSDGDGNATIDVSATLLNSTLTSQIFSGIDNSFTTPTDCVLDAETYYLLLSSNTGQASGVCGIKLY
jgi:hypothetical protein